MEIVDSDFEKPQLYRDKKLKWTEILGSDSHHLSGQPGGPLSWEPLHLGEDGLTQS